MLNDITWTQLILFLIVILIPYYLIVLGKYFRRDLKEFIRAPSLKNFLPKRPKKATTSVILTEEQFAEAFREIEQITYELRHKILPESGESREKMLELLGRRLQDFNGLAVPAFRLALTEQLVKIAGARGIELQREKLNRWWEELLSQTP